MTNMTKERPVLFKDAMVRAILNGTKTQTRRVLKQAVGPSLSVGIDDDTPGVAELSWLWGDGPGYDVHETIKRVPCPHGKPGERLWVRETFSGPHCMERSEEFPAVPPSQWPTESPIWYWADGEPSHGDWTKPRPSMFMPRWASRITLEITDVRVERLQDISVADAMAEGTPCYVCGGPLDGRSEDDCHCFHHKASPSDYRALWESINGPDSWEANPWVWAISFRKV